MLFTEVVRRAKLRSSNFWLAFTDGLESKGDTRTHAQGTDPKVAFGA